MAGGASSLAYGQRGARYGDGGTMAGVSGLTGVSGSPARGALGSAVAQSGMARYAASGGYQPRDYQPQVYGARALSLNPAKPTAPGMVGVPQSAGQSGDGGMGGGMGSMGANTAGMLGRGMGVLGGGLLGGPMGMLYGGRLGDQMGVGLGSAGPGADANTDPGSRDAVNGMDAQSDAADGSGGGGK